VFGRLLRLTIRLGVIAGIGVGIALVVKKLTQTPSGPPAQLEPWPPLPQDPPTGAEAAAVAAEVAADVAEAAAEVAEEAAEEAEAIAEEAAEAASVNGTKD
jgi:hypothetical protein